MSKIEVMALLEQFAGHQITMKDAADQIEALYVKPAAPVNTAAEPEHELWHMIEVDKKDIHILHVSGCNSWGKDTDEKCRVMLDLIHNKPSLAVGEYDAYANGTEVIKYVPRKKVAKTSQRALAL